MIWKELIRRVVCFWESWKILRNGHSSCHYVLKWETHLWKHRMADIGTKSRNWLRKTLTLISHCWFRKFGIWNCTNIKMMWKISLIRPNKNWKCRKVLPRSSKNGRKWNLNPLDIKILTSTLWKWLMKTSNSWKNIRCRSTICCYLNTSDSLRKKLNNGSKT